MSGFGVRSDGVRRLVPVPPQGYRTCTSRRPRTGHSRRPRMRCLCTHSTRSRRLHVTLAGTAGALRDRPRYPRSRDQKRTVASDPNAVVNHSQAGRREDDQPDPRRPEPPQIQVCGRCCTAARASVRRVDRHAIRAVVERYALATRDDPTLLELVVAFTIERTLASQGWALSRPGLVRGGQLLRAHRDDARLDVYYQSTPAS